MSIAAVVQSRRQTHGEFRPIMTALNCAPTGKAPPDGMLYIYRPNLNGHWREILPPIFGSDFCNIFLELGETKPDN